MTKLSLAELIDFMEKRCIGVDQSADAMRWKIIHGARAHVAAEPGKLTGADIVAVAKQAKTKAEAEISAWRKRATSIPEKQP
jgi:hypothetical protein